MALDILLSAFACDPYFGSDEEVGWQWARELSQRGHRVTVLTRQSHQTDIEKGVAETGHCRDVHFVYHDLPALHKWLSRFNRRNQIYYYFWQWRARRKVASLLQKNHFDLIHHITWVSFRQPSFLGGLGVPFIFGPVSGGDEFPLRYAQAFSRKERFVEVARVALNRLVRWDPFMRRTFTQADQLYFTSRSHLCLVPNWAAAKAGVELAIASLPSQALPPCTHAMDPARPRFVFAGRCIGWKGLDIGLQAFARVLQTIPGATLTVIGDGDERSRWQAMAQALGVAHAIEWAGWVPKAQVLQRYPDYDILFYPSLRDSGGFVVLEALQHGLPVLCFALGGPGQVVTASCGIPVEPAPTPEAAAEDFARGAIALVAQYAAHPDMREACHHRANEFTWDALVSRIYQIATPNTRDAQTPH
jgi:glycosyltransferase involved in cell wall biosynthesis